MKKTCCFFLLLVCLYPALAQNNPNPPINSAELIQKGVELHDKGQYKEAIRAYQQVHRSDTNYVLALYEMGLTYSADSQHLAAKQVYEEALSLTAEREREPELYVNYGSLIDDMGDRDRALRIFDSAIAKYPAYSPAYLNKATTMYRMEKYAEAEAVLKKVLVMDPYSYSSHYMLALCQLRLGRIVQAYMGFTAYLMVSPEGRYFRNSINMLNSIANNTQSVQEITQGKTDESETYKLILDILQAKIALNKDYKSLTKVDDPIARQLQVILEKLEYDESSNDFYMQYYVPLFVKIFKEKKYEDFVYHVFSNVNIDKIQDYNKRNKKEIQKVIEDIVTYLNNIRTTRELQFSKREKSDIHYTFSKGSLLGKGKWKDEGETYLGPWEYYYSGGNVKSKGNYDDKGERDGLWNYYYWNGIQKATESYKHGKLHGECVYYYSNGNISSKENSVDGDLNGVLTVYYMNGNLSNVTNYKNGKREGKRTEYNNEGILTATLQYKADSLEGEFKTFHANGQVETVAQYVNGKLSGGVIGYHSNGKVAVEGTYTAGAKSGTWKRYHNNGKLKAMEPYVNGTMEGTYEEYHRNGTLYTKYEYKKGKINGDISYYAEDGKLWLTHTYDNDILKAAKYFDKNGKQISESVMKSRKLDLTTYSSIGSKRSTITYNDKGLQIGQETYYYTSGNPSQVGEYKDGTQIGKGITYHMNGKKKSEIDVEEGVRNGLYVSYFPHGTVSQHGWYVNDQAEGYWTFYNEQGAKTTHAYYYNDEVTGVKQEFWPSGKLEIETWYNNGIIDKYIQYDTTGKVLIEAKFPKGNGKFTLLNPDGKLHTESKYVNGSLEGAYKVYYPNGSVQSLQFYKNGLNDSISRVYSYEGKTTTEGQFRMGDKVGTWKYYRPNGTLQTVEQYENGSLEGVRTHYFENGKVDLEMNYEDGERQGLTKKYSIEGALLYQLRYVDGIPVAYSYPDKTGKLVPEISLNNGNAKVKTYHPDGTVSAEFGYDNGKLNGVDNAWYANGKPQMISTEDFGNTVGNFKTYYPSGQLKSDYNYAYDNLHGVCKEYNEKGVLIEEGTYYNGYAHGLVKMYGDDGKLKATHTYYYGQLLSVKK